MQAHPISPYVAPTCIKKLPRGHPSPLPLPRQGVREISLGVASGLAYIWTGNLASPYAGALAMQVGACAAAVHAAGGAAAGVEHPWPQLLCSACPQWPVVFPRPCF
jgi:hypothetical protein